MALKRYARKAATAIGFGDVVDAYVTARAPAMAKRDQLDLEHMRLLLRFSLRRNANCIDIGANRGDILREILTLAPEGKHLAFEPLPGRADDLRAKFPAVQVNEVALSDHDGEASFTHVLGHDGYSGFRRQWYPQEMSTETITVRVGRLDDLLPTDYVPHFIKIDVEGAETDVLAGAMATITAHRPLIVFEHFEGGAGVGYGRAPKDVHDLLVGRAGMEIFDIDGIGPYSVEAMDEVFASRRLWTWVARPVT